MNWYATRVPKPVDVTALENRNAVKISHTVTLLNPERILAGGSVKVTASTVMAITTVTPIRTGCATREIIVATKTPSRRPCCWFNPGIGNQYRRRPGTNTTAQRLHIDGIMTDTKIYHGSR